MRSYCCTGMSVVCIVYRLLQLSDLQWFGFRYNLYEDRIYNNIIMLIC